MITCTIVKPRKSFILHHFHSLMLWKSTNAHFYNSKTAKILHFHIIVVHLSFENRPMIMVTILKPRKSPILHHFRSLMLWKSTNDHFSNSKQAEILQFASFSFTYALKINHSSLRPRQSGRYRGATEVVPSEKSRTDFRPSGGSGRPPTPSPPHAPTPAHPHTRSCTRIDFNTPRFSSFGKKIVSFFCKFCYSSL